MTAKRNSKATQSARALKVMKNAGPLTIHGEAAVLARHALDAFAISKEARQRAEAKDRAGITLNGARLKRTSATLSDVNMAAVSARQLAIDAIDCPERAEGYLIAIENLSKVIARKCDVLAALIGEAPGFGNFADEFTAEA